MSRSAWQKVGLVAWLAAAVLTWNTVYGTYLHWGVLDCIERQERHGRGLGPRVDISTEMADAGRRGVVMGTAASAIVLLPGLVLVVLWRRRH